jgi:hypothetical protein
VAAANEVDRQLTASILRKSRSKQQSSHWLPRNIGKQINKNNISQMM